ncbi:EMYY motif lipoprotein, partial [Staphylococcus chromogenes]
IQMYYELENYYKERAKNAINSEKLSEMNIKHVIRTSDELEHYETNYHQKNDELESQLQ